MKFIYSILFLSFFVFPVAFGQKAKDKKNKFSDGKPRLMEVFGDSVRKDSIVYYETEIGYIMPDLSQKFKGKWDIHVMRRQARANPDTLANGYIEFNEDTLFTANVGCNKLNGTYIIKGPTIKFTVKDSVLSPCASDIEKWFIKLIQERVSYFGIDEKILFLKDVAYNIVFNCTKNPEEKGSN